MAVKKNLPMLAPDQISDIHRLHWVEKWSVRKIASHLRIGRRTIAKYLNVPAPAITRRERASKLDPFKAAIAELLQQDPTANAPVIAQRLQSLGYDGGITIIKDYLRAVRRSSVARRAYVRMEPAAGERFDIDWGHFGALAYNGATRKLYAFCLIECHSRKMYLGSLTVKVSKPSSAVTYTPSKRWPASRVNFGSTISRLRLPNTRATWSASIHAFWPSLASMASFRARVT